MSERDTSNQNRDPSSEGDTAEEHLKKGLDDLKHFTDTSVPEAHWKMPSVAGEGGVTVRNVFERRTRGLGNLMNGKRVSEEVIKGLEEQRRVLTDEALAPEEATVLDIPSGEDPETTLDTLLGMRKDLQPGEVVVLKVPTGRALRNRELDEKLPTSSYGVVERVRKVGALGTVLDAAGFIDRSLIGGDDSAASQLAERLQIDQAENPTQFFLARIPEVVSEEVAPRRGLLGRFRRGEK